MEKDTNTRKKYYRTLSRNIVVTILVASITPMVIVSSIILRDFKKSYNQRVHDQLALMVWNHKKNINFFLTEKMANIRMLSNYYNIDKFRDDNFIKQKLAELQQSYDRVFVDLGLINDKGIQVSYAGPHALINADYSEAQWFKQAIGTFYYTSDVFYGLRGAPHFIISTRHYAGGRYWILRATIDFGSFNNLVENLRIGRTGFAFILNKSGEFQTKPVSKTQPPEKILSLVTGDNLMQAPVVITDKDETGKEVIYAAVNLKENNWVMVLQQDLKDAYAELNKTHRIALLIILIGSLGIIGTSLFLSRGLIRRIAQSDREKKLADKEKEMMSQQVIETGKLASIGELAAGIAHEINNPVAIMVEEAGWIEDLLEEEEFQPSENLEEFHRALRQINTQGKRCKDITHKLLSFARKTDSRLQEVVLNESLDEVVYLSEQRAKYSNIRITTRLHKNLPLLHASETELQQVFLNIVNNAIDAMEKCGGELFIGSKLERDTIIITIEDTGPGIAEVNLNRIFDPFFTTKPVGKGTGLGLSICYGIINKMGGQIEVQSQVNKGTCFKIALPAPKPDASNTEPTMPKIRSL